MAKQIGEDTKVTLDLKTIGILFFFIVTVVGMWFSLQADIQRAKELPEAEIQRIEYDLKALSLLNLTQNSTITILPLSSSNGFPFIFSSKLSSLINSWDDIIKGKRSKLIIKINFFIIVFAVIRIISGQFFLIEL